MRNVLLVIVPLCISLSPWWVHNARLHRRFIPLDTTGGINLLIGSGPTANGQWDWLTVSRIQQDLGPGVDVTTPGGSDHATAAALTHLLSNPGKWIRLVPAKVAGLLAIEGREHAYLYSIGYFGRLSREVLGAWAAAILLSFPLLALTAAAGGAVRGGVDTRVAIPVGTFLISATALHLLSFGDPRFHLPFVRVLAVLVTGIGRIRHGWSAPRVAALVVMFAVLTPAWYAQTVNYLTFLRILMAPGGWHSQLSFDDLL